MLNWQQGSNLVVCCLNLTHVNSICYMIRNVILIKTFHNIGRDQAENPDVGKTAFKYFKPSLLI